MSLLIPLLCHLQMYLHLFNNCSFSDLFSIIYSYNNKINGIVRFVIFRALSDRTINGSLHPTSPHAVFVFNIILVANILIFSHYHIL